MKLVSVDPKVGSVAGGNVVLLQGDGFSERAQVFFGEIPARVLAVDSGESHSRCYVQAPAHAAGTVDICLESNANRVLLPQCYAYRRAALAEESELTRLIRTLLRQLKHHLLENVSMTVAVDYAGPGEGDLQTAAMAKLPALVLTGPDIATNRVYITHESLELADGRGSFMHYRPPSTVDLSFTLLGAAASTVELLNLLSAASHFVRHQDWLTMPRDPAHPSLGEVRWELDPWGETRTQLEGPDGVRAFSCGFVVRGFDFESAQPQGLHQAVDTVRIRAEGRNNG